MGLIFEASKSDELIRNPFTAPPHPSELQEKQRHASSSLVALGNPHDLPTFTEASSMERHSPVLYLPPLLSSLPHHIRVPVLNSSTPPLSTETRLPNIDPASLSLHKALHHFRPLNEDYAVTPYAEAFNWNELELPEEEEREWYIVAFRSKRKAGSDGGRK